MHITIPPELESALNEYGRSSGKPPEVVAIDALRERFGAQSDARHEHGESLADFLRGHVGVLHSGELVEGGAGISEHCGERFSALLAKARNQSRS